MILGPANRIDTRASADDSGKGVLSDQVAADTAWPNGQKPPRNCTGRDKGSYSADWPQ
jgi:hypothetical protein